MYRFVSGVQFMPSSPASRDGSASGMTIEKALRALGVKWLRTVRSYSVAKMAATLTEAMRSAERGLKVIIADGECQLVRQRRVRAEDAGKLERGETADGRSAARNELKTELTGNSPAEMRQQIIATLTRVEQMCDDRPRVEHWVRARHDTVTKRKQSRFLASAQA